MAESSKHMEYVRRIVEYVKTIPADFTPQLLVSDLPESPQRPTPTLDGYIPDVRYRGKGIIIIGEAKTIHDIDNDHTERQICSYIDEVRCYKGDRHIVMCSNITAFALIKNMIVRKKVRENLDGIMFHILDNLTKVAVV